MTQDKYRKATAYESTPKQVHNRVLRNKARRELEREGRVHKGDGKEVAHKVALENHGSNKLKNVEVQPMKQNRGWRRGRHGYSVPNV